ncbi:MAG: hypothetical protein CMP76_06715 [Flavobacterium sp.]|uniref:hypothetical protein n=1 Tax=Flavobacterium sp. TaxID=239 RepID=UPI000C40A791|nr:hypothetical protein [Flavobacterium sp.]MBF02972.1 hypothetical protein [Flavobacterium sp.]|tara:strand:+ start:348 stop:1109 length:762 start_codon:yes stop_codon:yes gene_type:complete
MKHNKQLNEIVYLIERYYIEEKISPKDLETIQTFCASLTNESLEKSKFQLHYEFLKSIGFFDAPIKNPEKYWHKFNCYFRDSELSKFFAIKSTLLSESINNKKDVILKFVEIEGSFDLIYILDDTAYLINDREELEELKNNQYYVDAFDRGLGTKLDKNYDLLTGRQNQKNTRKVTITYSTNFEDFTPDNDSYIIIMPGIVDDDKDPNHDRFTLMMRFGKKINGTINRSTNFELTHFDTFQLCPPYPDGQNHC